MDLGAERAGPSTAPINSPGEEQVRIKPSWLGFRQLMGYLDNSHQENQGKSGKSNWGASIANLSAQIGEATVKKMTKATSGLRSVWKTQTPRRIQS